MFERYVRLTVWLALGLSALQPVGTLGQQPMTHAAAADVETRGDALPPGIFLDEEAARGLVLQPGMTLRVVFSPDGINLTKDSEGWIAKLYNDSAGYCTIGYGHLVKKRPCDGTEPPELLSGLSMAQGEELLREDMKQAEIAAQVLVDAKLDDPQYAAVVDFVFNVGVRNFQTSTLRQVIIAGPPYSDVPHEFNRWVRAGGKVWPGLQTRRSREVKMFFTNIGEPRGAAEPVSESDQIDLMPNGNLQ